MAGLKRTALLFALTFVLCFLTGCAPKRQKADFSNINKIAEMATYECYYHNVASFEEPGNQFVVKYGNKKVWIEYTGVVKIGIDASKVVIQEADNQIVKISVPRATILGTSIVENSIQEPLIENGIFAKITAEDKVEAMAAAQKNMEEMASHDVGMLEQGDERVRVLLENFVKMIGKENGNDYQIQWEYVNE